MNSNWEVKKLGEICKIRTGKKDVNQGNINGEYPFFTCAKKHTFSDVYSFDTEALLIAGNGDVGNVSYYNGKFEAYQRTYVLSDFENILPSFLNYFLEKNLKQNMFENKLGNTIPYIKLGMISGFDISFPTLEKQRGIVKKIDEVFSKIDRANEITQKNLDNAKELFESFLEQTLSKSKNNWETKKLDDVCSIDAKLVDPREKQFLDMLHVGGANIETKKGTLINLKTAKEESLISGKFEFDENIVLYSKIRPYLMKVVKCDFKGLCSADIYPLNPFKDKITQGFLYYLLLTDTFTKYAILNSQRAGMPKVNRKSLFSYEFYLPPIQEQKEIVEKLDAMSEKTKKLEEVYKKKLDDLEELKKSTLDKAFKGEL